MTLMEALFFVKYARYSLEKYLLNEAILFDEFDNCRKDGSLIHQALQVRKDAFLFRHFEKAAFLIRRLQFSGNPMFRASINKELIGFPRQFQYPDILQTALHQATHFESSLQMLKFFLHSD